MAFFVRLAVVTSLAALLGNSSAEAETPPALPPALRGVNPRLLSGGLYTALDAAGAFGNRVAPRAARDGVADPSKGKPPAVLDARVGPNVRLGSDPTALPSGLTAQAEPHVARSATNPDLLLATFQEGRYTSGGGALDCGYAISRDGGLTWTRALVPQLTQASGGTYRRATDPVAAIGPQGDLYLNALASIDDGFGTANVVVSRSTDNGATWSTPIPVFQQTTSQASPDKNWIAVNDYPGTPNFGRLVCAWTNFTSDARGVATGANIVLAVSDDRGATWSAPTPITPANSVNQGSFPVFLPDGSLLIVFATATANGPPIRYNLECKRSTDGGRTFPAASTIIAGGLVSWDDPVLRSGVLIPSAAVARQSGDIFVSNPVVFDGTPRIIVCRSRDRGATWSQPFVASDNPEGVSVVNPAIAATPDGATVSVAFIDKRLSPTAPDGQRYFLDHYTAFSTDGGTTWQPNVRLSSASCDMRYAPRTGQGYMLGDYLGLAPPLASDPTCIALWCDTRTGDADPYSARVAPAAAASLSTWNRAYVMTSTGDLDGDGLDTVAEFALATDPRQRDYGDEIVAYRLPDNTLAIASVERPGVPAEYSPAANTLLTFADTGTAFRGASTTLTAAELPSTPTRPGLAWAGKKFSVPANRPLLVERGQAVVRGTTDNPVFQVTLRLTNGTSLQSDARLVNLSTRGQVGAGADQLIAGFVADGDKSILIRAAGPALAALGVSRPLVDPFLTLTNSLGLAPGKNDNWQQSNVTPELFARLGAFPFANGSRDAALLSTTGHAAGTPPTSPQVFSALVSSVDGGTGVALAELFDADAASGASSGPRLLNLSSRSNVGTGDNALIAGFVLGGTQPRRVLLRAVGPTLATLGVSGALSDPQLELFRGNQKIAANDDWELSRSSEAVVFHTQRAGAFALNPASLDAALLITLPPGSYTAVVTGVGGATGIALVEIYNVD